MTVRSCYSAGSRTSRSLWLSSWICRHCSAAAGDASITLLVQHAKCRDLPSKRCPTALQARIERERQEEARLRREQQQREKAERERADRERAEK